MARLHVKHDWSVPNPEWVEKAETLSQVELNTIQRICQKQIDTVLGAMRPTSQPLDGIDDLSAMYLQWKNILNVTEKELARRRRERPAVGKIG
jgi:hypothetical protein